MSKHLHRATFVALALAAIASSVQTSDARGGRGGGGGARMGGGGARTSVNRGGGGSVNVNSNRTVNRNVDRNVDRGVDGRYAGGRYYGGVGYRGAPVARTAVAVGTVAAVGSMAYSLPAGCTDVDVNGMTYNECGGTYYQPQYEGDDVSYEVVDEPE